MIGTPRLHLRLVSSTNERARELARSGAPHGTLVTAAEQSSGRGRQGRSWLAEPGEALLMSLLVRGLDQGSALLPLAAALAVCEACESLAPVECQVKWPNDVWIARRKAAGILIEGRPQEGWAVVGIGLNVRTRSFAAPLDEIATPLAIAGAPRADIEAALAEVLERLAHWMATDTGAAAIIGTWRKRDALLGERVRWSRGTGVAAGVDDGGALLVDLPGGGRAALDSGEVHLVRD
ncbi:MAG: hypothetical protein NVS2B6_17570 [Thermoleophilaceae bacterium]